MKSQSLKTVVSILLIVLFFSCDEINITSKMKLTNYQSFGGHRYAITSNQLTWDEAKQFALEQGGYLVIIDNDEENGFIHDTYRETLDVNVTDILWIGLTDVAEEGIFRWVNGEIPLYTNWSEGEPNNDYGIQNYGHMFPDGTWDDVEVRNCYAIVEFDD